MFQVETITSFDDPRLAPYRNMRRQYDHAKEEIFVAEGDKVVRRLLKSPFEIISALFPEKYLAEFEPLLKARPEKISVFVAELSLLEQLTGFAMYQGVLALAKMPSPSSLEDVLKNTASPRFFVAVDGVSNPENMGGLVRNCAALGVQALIVSESCCTPYLRRAVRNSMGTIFKMPFVQTGTLVETIRFMREKGVRCIAAHPHTDQKFIFETDFTRDCCIVFGSEGHGISEEVRLACDEAVAIPMYSGVDSLNVGNAAAIFLYEVARQRAVLRGKLDVGR